MSDNYKLYPALAAYIDRIGAEQLNFRRFMVKEHRGKYYTEKSLIKITPDGDILCDNEEYAPTEEELKAIQAELATADFPKAIGATEPLLKKLTKQLDCRAQDLFALWSRTKDGTVIRMVQQRVEIDGAKYYLPWTYFSDSQWRRMEPEGKLPFWKPRTKREKGRIMVHEGAKAARFVDWMLNDPGADAQQARAAHPWTSELDTYEHWGIIGGALAPHRADYDELRAEKPSEVVYVCDNDFPGQKALEKVAQHYSGSLKGIRFNDSWPPSFDLADAMPKKMFGKSPEGKTRWKGPDMKALMVPATWATDVIPNPAGEGRPLTVLRAHFIEEWLHSIRPAVIINRHWPHVHYSADEFNSAIAPFSHLDDTARLLRRDGAGKTATLHYMPSAAPGIFTAATEGRYINTHVPSPIRPEEGDIAPFIDFIDNLFPEAADRLEVYRWVATIIARPDIKILYGMLIISEAQGVGKTTLGEKILAPLVGHSNVSFPSETDIVESSFNSWIAHKRLAIVNEIYAGSSTKAYNKLKSVITDKFITVNQKYQVAYDIENWLHIYACSNSMRAIQLSADDRRWFVPKVTEEVRPRSYWSRLNDWLTNEGGLGIIKAWARQWCLDNAPVEAGATAPTSLAKIAMIDESLSPGLRLVGDFLDDLKKKSGGKPIITSDVALVHFISQTLYEGKQSDRLEKPATVRKLAKARGWFCGDLRLGLLEHSGGAFYSGRIISTDPVAAKLTVEELRGIGLKFIDISSLSRV